MHKSKWGGFIIDCRMKRVQPVQTWWVMEAPTGQRFCVVRAAASKFAKQASVWS